ncbi:MAG: DUF1080 domain-containing protein [Planctomycetia bacterium]|nr:DUF1080 domain-containing protein [Planctomycetia bacterium]
MREVHGLTTGRHAGPWSVVGMLVLGAWLLTPSAFAEEPKASKAEDAKEKPKADAAKDQEKKPDPHAWKSLFDGKTLDGWKVPVFGGDGEVKVADGTIVLGLGQGVTGATWQGKPPRTNFELSLEGVRLDGNDFFATTTFPVGESYCSLVVGGWGGTVVGISNVDYYDAGDNVTTKFFDFKKNRWYTIRIRVSDARIEAWIDKEQLVDLPREGHKFNTRFEVDANQPLGVASWCTKGAVRNIRLRLLKPEEVAAAAKKKE